MICAYTLQRGNKGTIGGEPNKITPGVELDLDGGIPHTVRSEEALSGIAFVSFSLLRAVLAVH